MKSKKAQTLLALIADAHKRMATNRDPNYRWEQRKKCGKWLEELTTIWESDPLAFEEI